MTITGSRIARSTTMLQAKDHQASFPVAKGVAVPDHLRAVPDREAPWEQQAPWLSGAVRSSLSPVLRGSSLISKSRQIMAVASRKGAHHRPEHPTGTTATNQSAAMARKTGGSVGNVTIIKAAETAGGQLADGEWRRILRDACWGGSSWT
ncbi:hypothetical protein E4191_06250 [Paracoccus liaowanqingii]|uniref:Uncharacterized protein n=1 Tax=Paracoccus liaowanqingii TaxID=2560053 RepID=A0A4P7HJP3_9RHOB|nr:hypothetical protein [Paracoccus liaowanqingii]QBX34354.1 hypothetical protein E4191_06250 [Paracoccus liaowanqingii]